MDNRTPDQRRKNMQAVRSSGSKIEVALGRALWATGLRYRKNDQNVFGRPDFTFRSLKIAIFVDSEFWHGKDWEVQKYAHKSNQAFWHKKIARNIERDLEVNETLINDGWVVLRFWGRDIKEDSNECARLVCQTVKRRKLPTTRRR